MENINFNNLNALNPHLFPSSQEDKPNNQRAFGKNINNYPHLLQFIKSNPSIKDHNDSKYPWKILNKSSSSTLSNIPTKTKFSSFKSNKIIKCDEANKSNPQYITEYINDIFKDMYLNSSINKPEWGYFEITQDNINLRMRTVLLSWLLEAHSVFKFRQETFYLCVNIIDRFLSLKKVTKATLQLYGVTSLFIASKFEEIYPPVIHSFVHITNYCCKKEDIIKAEEDILSVLDFNILTIYSYTILERLHFMSGLPKAAFHLAQYILELSIFDYKTLCINDFNKALGSLMMAKSLMKIQLKFSEEILEMLNNNKNEIRKYYCYIIKAIDQLPELKLKAWNEKFKSPQFSSVSLIYLAK